MRGAVGLIVAIVANRRPSVEELQATSAGPGRGRDARRVGLGHPDGSRSNDPASRRRARWTGCRGPIPEARLSNWPACRRIATPSLHARPPAAPLLRRRHVPLRGRRQAPRPGIPAGRGPGSIGEQLATYCPGLAPRAADHGRFALPAPLLVGVIVAGLEIVAGLGALTGLAYRLSAVVGALLAGHVLPDGLVDGPAVLPRAPTCPTWSAGSPSALAGHGGLYVVGTGSSGRSAWLRPVEPAPVATGRPDPAGPAPADRARGRLAQRGRDHRDAQRPRPGLRLRARTVGGPPRRARARRRAVLWRAGRPA